jgi:hypothetical protein
MTPEQISSYREQINKEIGEKSQDLDSNVFLVIAGALGFFLTINEKFIGLREARLKPVLFLSLTSLCVSLTMFIYDKYFVADCEKEILNFLDTKMKPNDIALQKQLLGMWEDNERKLVRNKKWIFGSLIFGIAAQMVFFLYNVMWAPPQPQNPPQRLRIEIVNSDTAKGHPLTIKTYNHDSN